MSENIKQVQKQDENDHANLNINNYWGYIPELVDQALRTRQDLNEFFDINKSAIDFGISPQVHIKNDDLPNTEEIRIGLPILTMSNWIQKSINEATMSVECEKIDVKIDSLEIAMDELDDKIGQLQKEREGSITELIGLESYLGRTYAALIKGLTTIDKVKYDSLLKNEAASRGRFFTVEERHIIYKERTWVQEQEKMISVMLSKIRDHNTRVGIDRLFTDLQRNLTEKARIDTRIEYLNKEKKSLNEEIVKISHTKISNHVGDALIRLEEVIQKNIDLYKGESGSFRNISEDFLDVNKLYDTFKYVEELDRHLLLNSTAANLGRPSILVIPTKGNGLYDPIGNLFIIPLVPIYDLAHSVAGAITMYRLHVDSDKKVIRSYNKLKENQKFKHMPDLIEKFIADYTKWITMEYEGHKVLKKEVHDWFLDKCAPKPNDIYFPVELISHSHNRVIESNIRKSVKLAKEDDATEEQLWYASLMACKQDRYLDANKYIKKLIDMDTSYIFTYYNFGIISMKLNASFIAKGVFRRFVMANPHSWWAQQAQKHIAAISTEAKG